MSLHRPPRSRNDFQTAIICTLPAEADAVGAMSDEYWDKDGGYTKAAGDTNAYVTGRIGHHNVVMAFVPGMGKGAAAGVAGDLRSSYPQVKLALVVGVCGAVPYRPGGEEILLGTLLLVMEAFNMILASNIRIKFIRRDTLIHSLQRPDLEIHSLIAKLKTKVLQEYLSSRSAKYFSLVGMVNSPFSSSLRLQATYPGPAEDKLYESTYHHKHHDERECGICSSMDGHICNNALALSCQELGCDEMMLVPRRRLLPLLATSKKVEVEINHQPVTHFGLIASGDTVMKSSFDRDAIAAHENVIAYEMEGAVVWDILPCLLIKGVCDYSDSHKNKIWQGYAAMTAAACLKAFLEQWTPTEMRATYGESRGVQVPSPSWTNEVRIEGEVEASVVSGTLANTGGINIGKKKKENKKDSSNESVSAPNQDGVSDKPVFKSRGRANQSHVTVNIRRGVSQSVVASSLANSGGIYL